MKPENVRLDAEGRAVLVDLGFARPAGAQEAPLGTPGYLAPERERGGAPAASADLFALGCLLFEAVSGQPVARNDDELAALRAGRSRPPSADQPRVSPLLDALVRSLLRVAPEERPAASEVATILEEGEASAWWRARIAYDAGARRDTVAWSGVHGLPMAGRDEELAVLGRAWEDVDSGGLCVLLTGPRGSGKSRLVTEFVHRLREGGGAPLYLYGRCNAIGDERPAAPLIALLRRWLHLPSGTQPGERVKALLEQTVSAEVARTLLATVRPDRDDRTGAEMTEAAALASWMLALPRTAPTILFLDDVQFAGDATLSALHQVARELEAHGLLLVLGLRSQAQIQREGGLSELRGRLAPFTRRLDLTPLGEDEVLGIVERLFHHSVPRLRLARVLHERTGGLPGSIAEILRLAAQRGWTREMAPPGAASGSSWTRTNSRAPSRCSPRWASASRSCPAAHGSGSSDWPSSDRAPTSGGSVRRGRRRGSSTATRPSPSSYGRTGWCRRAGASASLTPSNARRRSSERGRSDSGAIIVRWRAPWPAPRYATAGDPPTGAPSISVRRTPPTSCSRYSPT